MNFQEILSDDEEYETQQYIIRQKQINELQSKYQSKRNELDKYLKTEDINSSPRIFNYETNFSTNQTQKYQTNTENFPSYNQSNQAQQKDILFLTNFSSTNKKTLLTPTAERKSEYLTTNSNISENKKQKSPSNSIIHKAQKKSPTYLSIKRINKEVQTSLTLSCKINSGIKFQAFLQKIQDQSESKSTQTTQFLKQKNNFPIAQKPQQSRFKTENTEQCDYSIKNNNSKKVQQTNEIITKKDFEKWYNKQKTIAENAQNKLFQLRLEKEKEYDESQNQRFTPRILQASEVIVKQKFSGSQFMERQLQYDHYLKTKQQNREQEEIQEIKSQRFQMSPISRRIMRSITPKSYRDYSSSHTANTSWFGSHYIYQNQ